MNQIPINLLKSLIVFSDSANLSSAAEQLGITQPGLTKQLQTIEGMLPHPLFTVEGKRKRLTTFGHELVAQLKLKIEGLDSVIKQTCDRFSNPEDSTVRLIGRIGVLDRIATKLLFPGRLIFIDAANTETVKSVLNQTADLGITFLKMDSLDIISRPLYKEKFKLVIPKKLLPLSPSTLKKAFEQIKVLPCLTYKDPDEIFEVILAYFQLKTSELIIKRTLGNFESLISMTNNSLGWSIVPRHFVIDSNLHWVIDVPSSCHPPRQFYLYYRKEFMKISWFKELRLEIEESFKT